MSELVHIPWWRRALAAVGFGRAEVSPPADALAVVDFDRLALARVPAPGAGPKGAIDQAQTSTWRDWTPDLIRAAEMQADRGDLSLAAELCDALMSDAFIASKMGERVRSLVGAPLSFVEGQGRRKGAAKRAAEAGEDFWRLLPDAEYTQVVGWGVLLGIGPCQLRDWERSPEHGGRMLPGSLEVWHPKWFRFDWDAGTWLARDKSGREWPVKSGDGQWFLYTPFGRSRPWMHGLWRQVARVWLLKNLAIDEWRRSHQTNAARVVTAQLPSADSDALDDYTPEFRQKLVADLRTMGRNAVIALAPGLDLKLLEVGAETWESLDAQCRLCDEIVAVAFVGSSLSTSGDKAAYASSQTGQDVKRDIRAADANVESTLVHDDVMVPWSVLNFNDAGAAPWPSRQLDPPPTPKEQNEILEGFGNALASLRDKAGLPIDGEAMAKLRPDIILLPLDKRPKNTAPIYEYVLANPLLRVKEAREKYGWEPLGDGRDDLFVVELLYQLQAANAPKPDPRALPPGGGAGGQGGGQGEPPGKADGGKAGFSRAQYGKGGRVDGPAIEGQLYADRLVDASLEGAPKAFRSLLAETIAAVMTATSYDDVRARLLALAADADLEEDARDALEHLAMMAWSAGAYEGAREAEGGGGS